MCLRKVCYSHKISEDHIPKSVITMTTTRFNDIRTCMREQRKNRTTYCVRERIFSSEIFHTEYSVQNAIIPLNAIILHRVDWLLCVCVYESHANRFVCTGEAFSLFFLNTKKYIFYVFYSCEFINLLFWTWKKCYAFFSKIKRNTLTLFIFTLRSFCKYRRFQIFVL